jgi:hypothetical protein
LEGLVASIGGVDASLSKAASAALLAQLEAASDADAQRQQQQQQEGLEEGEGADGGLQARLPVELVRLWERERAAESSRLSLPLLRAAHLLITSGGLGGVPVPLGPPEPNQDDTTTNTTTITTNNTNGSSSGEQPPTQPFAALALQLCRLELRACADIPRLLEGATLVAALAGERACAYAALQSALALLVGRYPRVRRHAAEQLYLALLAAEDFGLDQDAADCEGMEGGARAAGGEAGGEASAVEAGAPAGWRLPAFEDGLEAAQDVLLTSPWDGPLDEAKAARGRLAQLLRVEVRARPAGAGLNDAAAAAKRAAAAAAAAAVAARDQYTSYQSLLDDAARGGGY